VAVAEIRLAQDGAAHWRAALWGQAETDLALANVNAVCGRAILVE